MTSNSEPATRRGLLTRLASAGAAIGLAGAQSSAQSQVKTQAAPPDQASQNVQLPVAHSSSRPIGEKLAERISVLDFDVDPTGKRDSTPGFVAAMKKSKVQQVFIPEGRYRISRLDVLGGAGKRLIGASRYRTVLVAGEGSGPVISSEVSSSGTTAFHLISDLTIDLQGAERVAIDLSSVNMTSLHRIYIRGAAGNGAPRGTGIRFSAPINKGAYDNAVYDCSFERLAKGVEWAAGANNNAVYNCRATHCDVGYHAAPSGRVDTPRIFGGRAENCRIGLLEGAEQGAYFAVRFEGSSHADIQFTPKSLHALVSGGLTASSAKVLSGIELARSPNVDAGDLGYWAIEESDRRPRVVTGRNVFGAAGKAPAIPKERDFAAYFADRVIVADTLEPASNGGASLGKPSRAFDSVFLDEGVTIGGKQIIGARKRGIAPDRSGSANATTVNDILAVLRAHGLIED